MWNRWRDAASGAPAFEAGKPWLLRFFDQIRFYPVSEEELLQIRRDFPAGRYPLRVEDGSFNLRDYRQFLCENASDITAFRTLQGQAFEAERERWRVTGLAEFVGEPEVADAQALDSDWPQGARSVATAVPGSVWKLLVAEGDVVSEGQPLLVIESMKMEFTVAAPSAGTVWRLACREGGAVAAGQDVVILAETEAEVPTQAGACT
jgi:urea carboxylase